MNLLKKLNPLNWIPNPFRKKKTTNETMDVVTHTVNDRLEDVLHRTTNELKEEGVSKAVEYAHLDEPKQEQTELTPFERQCQAKFQGAVHMVDRVIGESIAKDEDEIVHLEGAIKRARANEDAIEATVKTEAKEVSSKASVEADEFYEEESATLKKKISEKDNQIMIAQRKKNLIPLEKRPVLLTGAVVGYFLFMLGAETHLYLPCFEYLIRASWEGTLLITSGFSLMMAIGCHLYAKYLYIFTQKRGWRKKLLMLLPVAMYVGVSHILGEYRAEYIHHIDPSAITPTAFEFTVLSMILYAVMVYASKRYTAYDTKGQKERRKLTDTIKELEGERKVLDQRAEQLQTKRRGRHEQASSKFLKALESIHSGSENLQQKLNAAHQRRDGRIAFARNYELQIQEGYQEVIHHHRDQLYRLRPTKVTPAYWKNPLTLNLKYQNGTLQPSRPSISGALKALVLLITLGLFSCSQPESVHTIVLMAVDITDSFTVEELPSGKRFLYRVGFDMEAEYPQRLDIGLTVLSDVSANRIHSLSLDLSDDNRFNRKSHGKKFVAELDSALQLYADIEQGKQLSRLYRPLCRLLKDLHASNAKHKTLILMSDLIENSEIIQLYSSQYVSLSDFNTTEIKTQLTEKVPFPRCDGIRVIVVCQPYLDNDQLVVKTQSLYRALFTECGAESVTFTTHL